MKPKNIAHLLMGAANIAIMFLLVTAAFSDAISPEVSVLFAWLGLLFPFFLVLNALFLIYWLLVRKWMFLFIVCCSLLICWKPVSCYAPFHPFRREAPSSTGVIKLLTYNVMAFNYQPHRKEKPNRILQYIIDSKADIVCLQEYMEAKSEQSLTRKQIVKALGMYPYHFYLPLINYHTYTVGVAVYSKYPITKSWKVCYDSSFNGSTVHELDVHGKKLTVVNNHLESFKLTMEDRSRYEDFIKNINPDTFDDLRGTVQHKLGAAYLIRAEQADIIAEEIRHLKADYLVVCGDFNDTPVSYAHRTVQGELADAFVESGNGLGTTYNQNFFWFRIDHILHSPNMTSYRTTVDKLRLSDHYPVWCYLEMN
ncbi:MAG: endonuclease/exonuclease/phosphatase family protein [Tannerella sp.]|jgi:endonuclease/exonuclease/phosphatase family metal-dependent hydrolase|nr:endonuclease/exonuclease/phosphatase family protein [Tannerella sp.]